MSDDLRPQIAPKPPQYGRTSASLCRPPRHQLGMRITINERKHAALSRQTVKLNALTSSPHAPQPCHHGYAPLPNWRPTRTTNTHFPRCNSPTPVRHPALRPTQFLIHWHYNPHTTTLTSQPPIHSPHQYRHTPHTNNQSANPTTPLKPRQDKPIQLSRPNTPTNYR